MEAMNKKLVGTMDVCKFLINHTKFKQRTIKIFSRSNNWFASELKKLKTNWMVWTSQVTRYIFEFAIIYREFHTISELLLKKLIGGHHTLVSTFPHSRVALSGPVTMDFLKNLQKIVRIVSTQCPICTRP